MDSPINIKRKLLLWSQYNHETVEALAIPLFTGTTTWNIKNIYLYDA